MSKVKIKLELEPVGGEGDNMKRAINEKYSNTLIDYGSVPRIGEWVDLLELANKYELTQNELKWLSRMEHKYQIENVNQCDGFIEIELDLDKVWPEEA